MIRTTKTVSPLSLKKLYAHVKAMFLYHDHGYGLVCLGATLLVLCLLAGIPHSTTQTLYVAGDIATETIVADRDLLIKDVNASQMRQEQVRAMQPLIFDINKNNVDQVREQLLSFLHSLNTATTEETNLNVRAEEFNARYNANITPEILTHLTGINAQSYAFEQLLPWIDIYLSNGVLSNARVMNTAQQAIVIRDLQNKFERLVDEDILDLQALIVLLGSKIRSNSDLSVATQDAFIATLPHMLLPTLNLNQGASDERIRNVLKVLEPVFYQVKKGDILLRAGDMVTPALQLKMQSIFSDSHSQFNFAKSFGSFVLGFAMLIGLFMTPSGKKGRTLYNKDQLLISSLLLLVAVSAAALTFQFYNSDKVYQLSMLAFGFPIAGMAGLSVLIFSAKRYCAIGLLFAYFSTVLLEGSIELFLFYFLSSMMSTWLLLRAQSRQDILLAGIPLALWTILTGFATALLTGIPTTAMPTLLIMLLCNTFFSMCLLFAFAPLLEMVFNYTTRFRLMELMSLDHPLLQELMVRTPGTYHHSLVVSNLAESAAKAVGANSLLVKVGALYHDIGKLARPEYFSENQFNIPNPHDKLSPAMSTLILFSHVKHGVELAIEHNLGDEIVAMIQQHHGTRIPKFFFVKAEQAGEHPCEKDYMYPGPRPQSKEAAILMMADTVEAAIRSIKDPSPARIRATTEMLIKNIYEEGQFDESDMTFKDLNIIIESLSRSLLGLSHQRASYPTATKVEISYSSTNEKEKKDSSSHEQEKKNCTSDEGHLNKDFQNKDFPNKKRQDGEYKNEEQQEKQTQEEKK